MENYTKKQLANFKKVMNNQKIIKYLGELIDKKELEIDQDKFFKKIEENTGLTIDEINDYLYVLNCKAQKTADYLTKKHNLNN
jgi:hypothetical protein